MSRKTVVEEAVIQMKNLEDALKENAKGILASTMRQEINSLVKESLKEQDEVETDDEEEVDLESPEGEEDVEDEETFDVEDDDMDVEDDDMDVEDDDMGMGNMGVSDDDDEEAIDMRGASDEDVAVVFSKMGKNDKISIEKIGDYYDLKDTENDTEYIIKLNESDEDMFDLMGGSRFEDEDMFEPMGRSRFEDEDDFSPMGRSRFEDEDMEYEDDFRPMGRSRFEDKFIESEGDGVLYELEVDTTGDVGLGEDMMTYEDMSYEDLGEDMMTYEDMSYEDLDEMYMDEDMTYEDLDEMDWGSIKDETDQIKVHESKQKTGSASKFKYSKKPNQEGGFNTKMKEGSKRYGKSGKAKFDFDNEDPNSEIVMKIVNRIKGGKKAETKESSRTLGNGSNFRKGGLPKPRAHSKFNTAINEEVEILREKNDEYRKALDLFRTKLNEVAVFNSNLAYATRLFTEHSTTKQEKINILRRFDNVESLKESKNLYQSLKGELSNNNLSDKNINESFNRTVTKSPSTGSSANLIESKTYENPQFLRMKDLMGKIK